MQIKLLTFWLSELNSINLWPIAPIVLAVFLTWLRWSAIIVIFVHIGFRPIFFNGEFIIVVIWLNRQCYLVNHPALSSHPQKQALKYQDTMLFPAKWFHCITGGKAVELYIGSKFLVDEQFLIKFEKNFFRKYRFKEHVGFCALSLEITTKRELSSDCLQRDLGYRFY